MRWFKRLPKLPRLTPSEKTALAVLLVVLGSGAALRIWECSGVRLGPVKDWDSLRRLVIQARQDAGGDTVFPCFQAPPSFSEEHWPQRKENSAPESAGHEMGFPRSRSKKEPPAVSVDINLASVTALEKLPKVGPSTAKAIVSYRAAHGKFGKTSDLLEVKGIGPGKFAALRPFVCTGNRAGKDVKKMAGP